jgi:hypothetical protein
MQNEVHQIIFRDDEEVPLEGYVLDATESVRNHFLNARITIWDLDSAREFLRDLYPRAVLGSFDTLVPYAYKGDLFKYCLLRSVGGWYVDAGVRMLSTPRLTAINDLNPVELVLFRSTGPWDAPWNCSVALTYASRGQKFFFDAIQEVVANCKREHYGANPLSPTMTAFGRSIAINRVHENVVLGQVVDVTGQEYQRGFALPSEGVIAARKPRAKDQIEVGDVAYLGIAGGNNYVDLWNRREAYRNRRFR